EDHVLRDHILETLQWVPEFEVPDRGGLQGRRHQRNDAAAGTDGHDPWDSPIPFANPPRDGSQLTRLDAEWPLSDARECDGEQIVVMPNLRLSEIERVDGQDPLSLIQQTRHLLRGFRAPAIRHYDDSASRFWRFQFDRGNGPGVADPQPVVR